MNMKYVGTYLSQFFNAEFVDKEKYANKYPKVNTFQVKKPPIMVKLFKREEVNI